VGNDVDLEAEDIPDWNGNMVNVFRANMLSKTNLEIGIRLLYKWIEKNTPDKTKTGVIA